MEQQHCVAAALTLPQVDFAAFGDIARERLAPLRARVHCRASEPYLSAYPHQWGGAVTVTLQTGGRHRSERTHAKGDPQAPLTRGEMLAKARLLLQFGGTGNGTETLITRILGLSDDGPLPALEPS